MKGATIRPGLPPDAPAMVDMLRHLAEELGDGDSFATTVDTLLAHGFGAAPMFHTLVAERDGALVGLALFFRHYSTFRASPGVYLQDLWIAPGLRSSGLGGRLIRAVAVQAKADWGACYLALTTHGANDGARTFYARHGFAPHAEDVPMMLDGRAFDVFVRSQEALT